MDIKSSNGKRNEPHPLFSITFMSISFKLNSRIQLISINEGVFTFKIDVVKSASFRAQDLQLQSVILNFIKTGGKVEDLVTCLDDGKSRSRFHQFINSLTTNALIDFCLHFGNNNMTAIISPITSSFIMSPKSGIGEGSEFFELSRFAYFHHDNGIFLLESPLAPIKLILPAALFKQLAPLMIGSMELKTLFDIFPQHVVECELLVTLLIENGFLQPVNHKEASYLKSWEFHDLIFHTESRIFHSAADAHVGATYRFRNSELPPPPTFKCVKSEEIIKLYKPNFNNLPDRHRSFSEVLEGRRSQRRFNQAHPVTVRDLGEFLFRSIGIREAIETQEQDAIFRPYPAAGAIHEIECYIVVETCDGLKQGIYYYHPLEHALFSQSMNERYIKEFILRAAKGMGPCATKPQILIMLTSRFQKIAWKYEKIAYRSTLVSLGAMFQTMSLVATSMNLGSCIIGSGDSSLFAKVLKLHPLEESTIGEFAIGTLENSE